MKSSILFLGLLLSLHAALAQPAGQQQRGGDGPRKPPAEALQACQSLKAGAACKFTGPHGAMTGSCFAPEGKPLACRPEGGAARPPGAPASAAKR